MLPWMEARHRNRQIHTALARKETLCNSGKQILFADRHCSAYSKPSNMQIDLVRQAHDAGQVLQRHHSTCSNAQQHFVCCILMWRGT